jgi:rare lipoprotein A
MIAVPKQALLQRLLWSSFGLVFILSGCSGPSVPISDVTPTDGVSVSSKPYYCRGSWHYPQQHYEYDEVGLASWYGPGFHGKPKPSGEIFDQHTITAAHKTLPLPSVVRVTNLKNEKTAIVVVDDRGPFVYEGRIIDLALGAAKQLGCDRSGLAMVRVQALPYESRALARHLARFGRKGKSPDGRSWAQIYWDEIAHSNHEDLMPTSCMQDPALIVPTPKSSTQPSIDETFERLAHPVHLDTRPSTNIASSAPTNPDLDTLIQKTVPTSPTSRRAAPSTLVSGLYIKIGHLFIRPENAQCQLRTIGYTGSVQPDIHPASGQTFFTAFIGPLTDEARVQALLKELHQKGYKYASRVHR